MALKGYPGNSLPYFYAVLVNKEHHRLLLKDAWKSIGKVFILATTLDMIFQYMVLKDVQVIAAIVVAIILEIYSHDERLGRLSCHRGRLHNGKWKRSVQIRRYHKRSRPRTWV